MALNAKTSEEKDHAEFSASGSSRWLNCPGSHALSKTMPAGPDSKYAAEGTEAHACFEFLLKNRASLLAATKAAAKKYSDDMVEHALTAVGWVLERYGAAGSDAHILCETRVDASQFTCTGQFGTLDAAVVQEFGRLTVADYKYGAGIGVDPVEPDGQLNSQLVYYALGISHLYHHNFAEVELAVIQPRAYHESGETIRSVIVPMDDLLAWIPKFRNGVMATSDPNAPFAAGKWCRFCSAAPKCPELKVKAMKEAQVVFSDEKGLQSVPEPAMIQLPDLGTILNACTKLEAWIARVREHAEHVLNKGGDVPGYKLVQKRGQRKWIDAEESGIEAHHLFGTAAFTEPKLLSPAQLEKVAKGYKGIDAWVTERTETVSSGTTLATQDDKRPAVTSAQAAFGEPTVLIMPTPKAITRKDNFGF